MQYSVPPDIHTKLPRGMFSESWTDLMLAGDRAPPPLATRESKCARQKMTREARREQITLRCTEPGDTAFDFRVQPSNRNGVAGGGGEEGKKKHARGWDN